MNEDLSQNLRIYIRQLTVQLKDKEGELADLQRRFSKLQNRYDQLDYAFKNNLLIHQQQTFAMKDLHSAEKGLRKVERDHWEKFCKVQDELTQVTKEKEKAKDDLAYWKRAVIDQKIFFQGKIEECLKNCKLRIEADFIMNKKTLEETQILAKNNIQELIDRLKLKEEEGEVMRMKSIALQGDIDVLRHRMKELACTLENCQEMNENFQGINICIVKVLRSFSNPHDDYEDRIRVLHRELLGRISCIVVNPEENIKDYEILKSQNLVLREVVKKLKNELTKVEKKEDPEINDLKKELIQSNEKNKRLCNSLAEKDAELRKLQIINEENIEKLKINLELIRSKENEEKVNISRMNIGSNDCNTIRKTVEADKDLAINSESLEAGLEEFNVDKNRETYLGLRKEERVKKFMEQATRDMTRSLELNLEPVISEKSYQKNYITLQDKQNVKENISSYLNVDKSRYSKFNSSQLESIESHLNSIRYKEYTISFSQNHQLKIRHPIITEKSQIRFRSVYSEKEYQSIPIDETVLYFDCKDGNSFFLNSKITNCAVQTIPIPTENVFTQTTSFKENNFNSQASKGVKILNSENRAIERSLQDLEKTICEIGKETLGLARSMIVNKGKFPPSEEFFDCIKYLSQCGAT